MNAAKLNSELIEQAIAERTVLTATNSTTKAQAAQISIVDALKVKLAKLGVSMKTFFTSPLGIAITAVTVAAVAGTIAFDKYHVSLKEAKEELDNAKESYSKITSELESCNDELKTSKARMEELAAIDTPTFAEQEEYENLRKINSELERKISLLEAEQRIKDKEKNNAFIQIMNSDIQDNLEYSKDGNGNIVKGYSGFLNLQNYFTGGTNYQASSEAAYIEQQFRSRANLLDKLHKTEDLEEIKRINDQIDTIDSYLQSKSSEWSNISADIKYINSPTNEDERAVNEWLDFIADFQDKMLIVQTQDDAHGNANAKQNAINRIVDNWQFDKPLQELQDLGEQGEVTAKMLMNPKYDDFIRKLYEIGFIDSTRSVEELEKVALALNKVAEEAKDINTDPLAFSLDENDAKTLSDYQSKIDSISKSLGNLYNLEAGDITKIMGDFEAYDSVFEKWGVTGEKGVGNLRAALEEIATKLKETATTEVSQMTDAIEEMFDIINNPKGSIDKFSSEIEELEAVLKKARNGESIDNIETLINKYDDLEGAVVKTSDGYTLEEDAIISLLNTRIESYNSIIAYEKQRAQEIVDASYDILKALSLEEEVTRQVLDLWNQTGSVSAVGNFLASLGVSESNLSNIPGLIKALQAQNDLKSIYKEPFEKEDKNSTIDWMTTSLENLQEAVDDANRAFDNAKGIEAQKVALASLNGELEKLQSGYASASAEYSSRYETALSKLGDNRAEIQRKIEAGDVFDTKEFPSEFAEIINDAIDAWNSKRDADNKVIELGIDIDENSIRSLELDVEEASSLKDLAEAKLDMAISDADRLSIYKDLEGLIDNYYTKEIQLAEFNKDSVEVENLKLQKEKELYKLKQNELDLVREQNAFEIEQIEQQRKVILDEIDLKGGKGSAQNYNDLIGLNDQELQKRNNEYEFEIAKLAEIKETLGENSDEYREQWSRVNDIADSISECKKNTKEWGLAILQLPIDEIESTIEDLNEQLSSVQDKMEHMDSIASGAQAYIQDEIDEQQKLKDVIQDQIDSLQKSNDERQRAIALQKAQYELERAYSQRSVKVYREGEGFVYEQSQEAIRDAQENYDNLKFEDTIHKLEKQLEYYDDIIADLEEVKNKWASVRSEAEDYLNIQKALAAIGNEGIFNESVIESYTKQYEGLISKSESIGNAIDAFEEFKKKLESIVEKFEYKIYSYEEAVEQITQETNNFFSSSGLEGIELEKKVNEVVTTILDQLKVEGEAFDEAATNTEEDTGKQITAFEEVTESLREETDNQKEILDQFSKDIEEKVGSICKTLTDGFSGAFSEISKNIEGVTKNINEQLSSIATQAVKSISQLNNLLSEAKAIQSEITLLDNKNRSSLSVGGINAFGSKATSSTLQKYHTGLENGLVGEKGNTNIKEVALTKLQPNEIPAILKVNEAVLTELQQQNVMHNMASSFVAGVKLPKIEKNNTTPVIQHVNLTLPNVTNDGGYNRVVQELKSLQLDALQHSSRK